jgi:hypothetical protein
MASPGLDPGLAMTVEREERQATAPLNFRAIDAT